MMRIGSLCSGAGMLDRAVEQVFDAETVWHCEINDAASKALEYRYPGIPNHRDLTATDWDAVEPIDILTGGYPCQPFSQAGQRKGTDDERHIWPDVREAIRRVRPRLTILENVSGHRSLGFDRVLGDLAEDGMHVRWTSLRAADVGAPHQRERLFIVATNPALKSGSVIDGDDVRAWGGAGRHAQATRGSGDAPDAPRDGWHERRPEPARLVGRPDAALRCPEDVALLPTPAARDGKGGNPNRTGGADLPTALLPTPRASDGLGGNNPLSRPERQDDIGTRIARLLPTPTASDSTGGGTHPDRRAGHTQQLIDEVLGVESWGKYSPAIQRWEAVTRPAPPATEPNRNGNPRLSAAFAEWMMGWPAGWVTQVPGISRNEQLRIIGNGVVPQQAAAALHSLLALEMVA